MKTYTVKAGEIERIWYVADADGQVLGRFASRVAAILRGKTNPRFSPHLDTGEHVIVINAKNIRITGKKAEQKQYFRHTGYPGGGRFTPYLDMMAKRPERVIEKAVWGMLPHNRLGRKLFKKLKVYAGPEHAHQAQQPVPIDLK